MLPPIPQPLQYHQFADQSACFGVAHCFDTTTNALFVLAGLAGLRFLSSEAGRRAFTDLREATPYHLLFMAAILVGLGSGYYHLAPDNSRLVWDRAAISLALKSWLAAIICERVSLVGGLRFLLPLLIGCAIILGMTIWGALQDERVAAERGHEVSAVFDVDEGRSTDLAVDLVCAEAEQGIADALGHSRDGKLALHHVKIDPKDGTAKPENVEGAATLTTEAVVGGCPIRVPLLDIHTIGAGGGSIARAFPTAENRLAEVIGSRCR